MVLLAPNEGRDTWAIDVPYLFPIFFFIVRLVSTIIADIDRSRWFGVVAGRVMSGAFISLVGRVAAGTGSVSIRSVA